MTIDVERLQFVQRIKREDGGSDWWEAVSTDNPAVRSRRPTLEGAIRALNQKRSAPIYGTPEPTRPCQACGAALGQRDSHWSVATNAYECPV